ncbi:hypothetical protein D3C71_711990 [compost metagenome]
MSRALEYTPPAGATTFIFHAGVGSPDSKWPGARRASMPCVGLFEVERMPSGTAMRFCSSASKLVPACAARAVPSTA